MKNFIDLAGRVFNRLTVIRRVGIDTSRSSTWLCKCICGTETTVRSTNLRNGMTKSCGCLVKEQSSINGLSRATHGCAGKGKTVEYRAWIEMKKRCYNKNNTAYLYYGGRGITICDRWLNSFENFLADVGLKPNSEYSLDRVDVNGNYEPSNCKWATKEEQANNRRNKRVEQFTDEILIRELSGRGYYISKGIAA